MGAPLPVNVRRFLEEPNFAFLATLLPDGSPQVTPVWVDYDGRRILVNTVEGRAKLRNIRRDPRVALAVAHWYNPYSFAMVRGRVVKVTRRGADAHADRLVRKYTGLPWNPFRGQERRVVFHIAPLTSTAVSVASIWRGLAREWLSKWAPAGGGPRHPPAPPRPGRKRRRGR